MSFVNKTNHQYIQGRVASKEGVRCQAGGAHDYDKDILKSSYGFTQAGANLASELKGSYAPITSGVTRHNQCGGKKKKRKSRKNKKKKRKSRKKRKKTMKGGLPGFSSMRERATQGVTGAIKAAQESHRNSKNKGYDEHKKCNFLLTDMFNEDGSNRSKKEVREIASQKKMYRRENFNAAQKRKQSALDGGINMCAKYSGEEYNTVREDLERIGLKNRGRENGSERFKELWIYAHQTPEQFPKRPGQHPHPPKPQVVKDFERLSKYERKKEIIGILSDMGRINATRAEKEAVLRSLGLGLIKTDEFLPYLDDEPGEGWGGADESMGGRDHPDIVNWGGSRKKKKSRKKKRKSRKNKRKSRRKKTKKRRRKTYRGGNCNFKLNKFKKHRGGAYLQYGSNETNSPTYSFEPTTTKPWALGPGNFKRTINKCN